MKTVMLGSDVRRVSDQDAENMVKNGWKYCMKSEWKKVHSSKKTSTESPASILIENKPKHKDNSKGKDKKSKYLRKKEVKEG